MNSSVPKYIKKYQILKPSVVNELTHGAVVSSLARKIAQQLSLSQEQINDIAVAGFLHDIGKLELAKYVRGQEDNTLIIQEMRYLRTHPMLGSQILLEKGYSQEIVDMVKCHHENCDGSGYPRNLQKEAIPLGARIIRVCDVFAALTSDRSYREAYDIRTALELMIEESRYYDVRVFLALMNIANDPQIHSIIDTGDLEHKIKELMNTDVDL